MGRDALELARGSGSRTLIWSAPNEPAMPAPENPHKRQPAQRSKDCSQSTLSLATKSACSITPALGVSSTPEFQPDDSI